MTARSFPSPFDIPTPPGAEGWEELYSPSVVFSEDRRAYESSKFWFLDGVHWPHALAPFDACLMQYCQASLSVYNNRHFRLPTAMGLDFRILNGRVYLAPLSVHDPTEIQSRVPEFLDRAGYYYDHWDELYRAWIRKVEGTIEQLEVLSFCSLPEMVDREVVVSGRGRSHLYDLQRSYHLLLDLALELWQYHFEMLNLGYAAYLGYFAFTKQLFPDIPDLAIARMVAGIEVDLFRPDEELRRLAKSAMELNICNILVRGNATAVFANLEKTAAGREWLARYETARNPWFNYSDGSGFHHTDKVWADHPDVPLSFIRGYVTQLEGGESIDRPMVELVAARDRITNGYAALLDGRDHEAFMARLSLARRVFHYVENHNLYIEHFGHSVIWRKMRELSAVFVAGNMLSARDDIFFLRPDEIGEALWDMSSAWAVGTQPRGVHRWPVEVPRRRAIIEALEHAEAPPALGEPPATISEPLTVMLWGITTDSLAAWLGLEGAGGLGGFAASPGVAEGTVRVIEHDNLSVVRPGEVLVARTTAPSWAPVFRRVVATVTDTGGMMSHAAIVCREYGLPAVTGTVHATTQLRTGMLVRVDGTAGTVTVLEPPIPSP